MDPHDRPVGSDLGERVGEALVDGLVGVPVPGVVGRVAQRVVVERPQRVVGEALVVVLHLVARDQHGVQAHAVVGERLGGVVGLAGPADPRAAASPAAAGAAPARARRGSASSRRGPRVTGSRLAATTTGRVGSTCSAGARAGAGQLASVPGPSARSLVSSSVIARHPVMPVQRLLEVGDEVGGRLDADRQADQVVGHLQRRAGHRGVGHLAGVLDQALDRAERLGEREQLGRRGDPLGGLAAAAQREADHPAEVAHLLGRGGVAGMVGQLRVQHPLDGRVARRAGRRRPGRSRSGGPCARRAS